MFGFVYNSVAYFFCFLVNISSPYHKHISLAPFKNFNLYSSRMAKQPHTFCQMLLMISTTFRSKSYWCGKSVYVLYFNYVNSCFFIKYKKDTLPFVKQSFVASRQFTLFVIIII